MAALNAIQFKACTNVSKRDVKILKRDSNMSITNSKLGLIFISFDGQCFDIVQNAKTIFSTKCEKTLINFMVNDVYIIE